MMIARFDENGKYLWVGNDTLLEPGVPPPPPGPHADAFGSYRGFVDQYKQYHDIATDAPVDMPPSPSSEHVFDYATKTWVDPRTLLQLKDAKWEDIKLARDAAIHAPLATPYGMFDADAASGFKITQAVLLANNLTDMGQPVEIDFTLADNSTVTLSASQMIQVGLLLGGREQQLRARATAIRVQIYAATSQTQLDAMGW